MKRLSSAALALLATLMVAVPSESQAFFGFFGGGFSFGIGSGWGWGGPGWGWGGPGYWYRPWYHRYGRYPYWRYRRWLRRYGPYSYYGLFAPYYPVYPYVLTTPAPAVKAPESAKEK